MHASFTTYRLAACKPVLTLITPIEYLRPALLRDRLLPAVSVRPDAEGLKAVAEFSRIYLQDLCSLNVWQPVWLHNSDMHSRDEA